MSKKLLAVLLAALMVGSLLAGCSNTKEYWESYDDSGHVITKDPNGNNDPDDPNGPDDPDNPDDPDDSGTPATDKQGNTVKAKTSKTKKATTTKVSKTKKQTTVGTTKSRVGRKGKDTLKFTPEADSGANYSIKGTVKIAVDTVRPADYDALFDVMKQLYPNIDIQFDYWQHSSNDDGREYLTTRMKTGNVADIMWDEAGEMPQYISQGWVRPITKWVNADPEAKNIPANVKSQYTFGGDLWCVPHQATFECTVVNTTLLKQLGGTMPKLNWTWEDYEKLLRLGASGFSKKLCVGIMDLFEVGNRYGFYKGVKDSGGKVAYATHGFNYSNYHFDEACYKAGAREFRRLREIPNVEGWYLSTQGGNPLSTQLGLTSYTAAWNSGKALLEDCGTYTLHTFDTYKNLKYEVLPPPHTNGNVEMHIDQCFITSACKNETMDAAYQLLRFMSFTTNGNMARLQMYTEAGQKLYNLNSHIYYPVTTNQKVINTFNALSCASEADKYFLKNIPNCSRFDAFKIIPDYRNNYNDAGIGSAQNNVTDGLDPDASGLTEPIKKFNDLMDESVKKFDAAVKREQAKYK